MIMFRQFTGKHPTLHSLVSARTGSKSTRKVLCLTEGLSVKQITGGRQKHCFAGIMNGTETCYRNTENNHDRFKGKIISSGNPVNAASIIELAQMVLANFERNPLIDRFPPFAGFRVMESSYYYGKYCQVVVQHKPGMRNVKCFLHWILTG